MNKKKLYAVVERGKIIHDDLTALGKAVSYFEGKEIKITLEKKVYTRTIPQNAYFHVAHLPIINDELIRLGWDNWNIDKTKDYLKDMFLRREVSPGKFITLHTSELDKEEFSVFLEQCSLFAWHDLHTTIPPAKLYKIDLNAEYVRIAA